MDIPNLSPNPIVNIVCGLSSGVFFLNSLVSSVRYLIDCYVGKKDCERIEKFMTLASITFSFPFFVISSFVFAAGWLRIISLIFHR